MAASASSPLPSPSSPPPSASPPAVIQEGAWVILQMGDGRNFFACAQQKGMMRLGRVTISLSGLIGVPYGSVLEVHPDRLVPLPGATELYEDLSVGDMDGNDFARGGAPLGEYDGVSLDNRNFADTNTAQRLSMEEVEELKRSGASGQAIIQALASNSDTWEKKTAFAKQKWTQKKAHKYVVRVRALAGCGSNVAEALFVKSGLVKTTAIRPDSIAQLLSFGNVAAGARVLILDSYSGVVLGCILERLGGEGKAISLYAGAQAHIDHLKYFNLPTDQLAQTLVHFPASALAEVEVGRARRRAERGEDGEEDDARFLPTAEEEARAKASGKFVLHTTREGEGQGEEKAAGQEDFDRAKWLKYLEKKRRRLCVLAEGRKLLIEGADCLVVASRHDPSVVVPRLLAFLEDGAAFAVYHEYLEPLVALYASLMEAGMLRLQMLSTWWREYQILPGRSHPHMSMSSDGGYLLTGIKVSQGEAGQREVGEEEERQGQEGERSSGKEGGGNRKRHRNQR
ncbi:hypothetical protein NSK_004151 [Nannochloropsis salina CCMP1776]|uniref:tRNA (adenine(58)-N(1))-methyltransferase non-catalytic subunit TRM6 n=1 Tax=Nannochloropsis salina CCMP1776 TaxID=1027361 RepID=A0A4D9D2T9_9STRA|nr:hypothetical protein NSK_004151 [Nannochloropsis salina CCMP1776]|eukprot:TFJ84687.1 hypothetical protein NSK_004151 [Nannochloropsis salina CCMP1776]